MLAWKHTISASWCSKNPSNDLCLSSMLRSVGTCALARVEVCRLQGRGGFEQNVSHQRVDVPAQKLEGATVRAHAQKDGCNMAPKVSQYSGATRSETPNKTYAAAWHKQAGEHAYLYFTLAALL